MKKFVLFASAILALASCTSDTFTGSEDEARLAMGDRPISFGFDVPTATRDDATGATAAAALNNQFIVYAEKNETSGSAPSAGNLVFQNYQVNYGASTAYTTTSNTKDWEYVGAQHSSDYQSHITTSTTDVQTIKYWDYGASNYVFTAVSALPADITAGRVSITKTTSGTTVYDKGYSVTLAKDASDNYPSLANLYFSDRNVITKSTGTDRTAKNAYGGNSTMTFRNSLTQVRVGMYETVPGYAITAIDFKVTGDAAAKNASNAAAFGAICPNVTASNFEGTITVTYYDNTDADTENHPKLTIAPASGLSNTDLILGTNINAISTSSPLATTAADPTYDTSGGAYTAVLPQISNTTNLKLKVNYTLYNSITKETITVEDATAEVPAAYLTWKPNFKYTYLFEISDNTNGHSGGSTDPAGLYPITFDAVQVVASDGQAEYITTVSEPSITTFGVKDSKYVYGGNEYAATSDIYATFLEGSTVKTPTIGTNVNIYKVTTTSATNFPITEASVAESVANPTGNAITATLINTDATTNFTAAPAKVTTVPGEDGVDITQDALKLTGVKAGTYALEYTASAAWTGTYTKVYKVIVVQ